MAEFYHSVTLNEEKCVGCTNCIKRCPTEAIRVRGGKAVIAKERCIDCGECIRICPHHAKRARHSHLSELSEFTYNIALPAPALYGQFNNLDDIDYVLTGLKAMGFDDVFEVARAAELISIAHPKFRAELGGQRLVVRDDERGTLQARNDVSHRERLAAPRHAEKNFRGEPVFEPGGEFVNGGGLISARRITADKFERFHNPEIC